MIEHKYQQKNCVETMSGYPPKFIENIIGIVDIEQVKINFVIKGRLFIYIVKISKNINKKIKFMCCG